MLLRYWCSGLPCIPGDGNGCRMTLPQKPTLARVEAWKKAAVFPIPAEAQFGMLNGLRFKLLHCLDWLSSIYRAPDNTDEAIREITQAARQLKTITFMLPEATRRHNAEYSEQDERRVYREEASSPQ